GAEHGHSGLAQAIRGACDERRLRADHDQVGLQLSGEADLAVEVGDRDVVAAGELRDAGVSRRGVQLRGRAVGGEATDDRMLAASGADDEDLHAGQANGSAAPAGEVPEGRSPWAQRGRATIARLPAELPDPADAPAGATARLPLDLSYDGTDFHGSATQPGQRTVQGELEAGLARVTRTSVKVTVAGRTDAGVHARGQVCHLDLPQFVLASLPGRSERSPAAALVTRLAGVLPRDVVVHMAREVTSDFDARFGAQWRRYRYRISDSPAVHDPLRRDVLRHRRPLDVAAMARASAGLLGEHDFLSFCRPREGGTTVRELRELRWERPGEGR